jgi:uncharacterized tellurite resistance protein B-like protein
MSIADLSTVLKIFSDTKLDSEHQKELFAEALLMTLARASSSDANIHAVEIESIQQIMERETGEAVSSQDVRKAARTELYETAPLRRYLSSVRRQLTPVDRVRVVQLLADVIKSDTEISVLEVDFFNMVAEALRTTPAELAGLIAS